MNIVLIIIGSWVLGIVLSYLILKRCVTENGRCSWTCQDRGIVILFSIVSGPIGLVAGLIWLFVGNLDNTKPAKW